MANLLDMARLQSDSLKLRAEWCDIQDIVGVALREIHDVMEGHPVMVNIASGLPLVEADFGLIEHVLSYADLPPIKLELERIELRDLAARTHPKAFLVPCRSGGLDDLGAPVYFLDERPAVREEWVLIGCERSLQFHRHYYGDEPPRIEMCPRAIAGKRATTSPCSSAACLSLASKKTAR